MRGFARPASGSPGAHLDGQRDLVGRQRLNTVDPRQFSLLTRPDLRAFDWIRENTPDDAGFLVNSFFAFNNSLNVGSDGGWWLPLLTKRDSSDAADQLWH